MSCTACCEPCSWLCLRSHAHATVWVYAVQERRTRPAARKSYHQADCVVSASLAACSTTAGASPRCTEVSSAPRPKKLTTTPLLADVTHAGRPAVYKQATRTRQVRAAPTWPGARLREAEDVVDEEEHVLVLDVAEVLRDGEPRERDAGARPRRLIHLAIHERALALAARRARLDDACTVETGICATSPMPWVCGRLL